MNGTWAYEGESCVGKKRRDKAGLAGNAGARFCGGNTLEDCKRRWERSKRNGKLPTL